MTENKVLAILENGWNNLTLVATLSYSPVMPFVSSIVIGFDHPVLCGRVASVEDWLDFVHSAWMSGFYPWTINLKPVTENDEPHHETRFEYEDAKGKVVIFSMFVPANVLALSEDKGIGMFKNVQ